MKESIKYYSSYLIKGNCPSDSEISLLLKTVNFNIDKDYMDFIKTYDGCEGCFENGKCILFWKIKDLIKLNPYYDFIKECKSLFFIGSDGSNMGYAFDKQNGGIISIDFLDIGVQEPIQVAKNFEKFLEYLSKE